MTPEEIIARMREIDERNVCIESERLPLVKKRREYEGQSESLARRLKASRDWMNPRQYEALLAQREQTKKELFAIEGRLSVLKSERTALYQERDRLRLAAIDRNAEDQSAAGAGPHGWATEVRAALRDMRDRYQAFASDQTRVSSMRIMASEFAEELTRLLSTTAPAVPRQHQR